MASSNWEDLSLKLEDGVELVSRKWAPKGSGPWPTLLMRQPYGRCIASTVTYPHPTWWASKGYLVIIQDVRGQGGSGGEFQGFSQEALDTSKTHAWVRSLPECNGKLGTYGFSYQGLTQLIAKPNTKPPDCLVPAMTGIDERDHWSCDGGAHWWHLGISWGIQLAALKARREGETKAWEELRESLDKGTYLKDGKLLLEKHDPQGMVLQWLNQAGQNKHLWNLHQPLKSWLRQPMLLIGGWWDPHLRGIIDLYYRSKKAGGQPKLHIGPATHLNWWETVHQTQLDFFDLHLKGKKNCPKAFNENQFWNLTSHTWQASKEFSKKKNSQLKWWGLFSNGKACFDSKDGVLKYNKIGTGAIQLVHDPWRAVPAIGGHLSPRPGPANRSEIDLRCDVATFTTEATKKEMYLIGIPVLETTVHSDQPGFDLCICLSVISPGSKKVSQLSTGFLRILGKEALIPTFRKVELQPLLASIYPGDKLRISIAGAAWPAIGVNPGNETLTSGPPKPNFKEITLALDLQGSFLKIKKLNLHPKASSR